MLARLKAKGYGLDIILVLLITILFTGLIGLVAFSLFLIFSEFNLGRDTEFKHGLTSGKSRLGGVAILLSITICCAYHFVMKNGISTRILIGKIDPIILLSLAIGSIGFAEDLRQNLSSSSRLFLMIVIASIGLYLLPELIPLDLVSFQIFGLNNSILFIYSFTIIMVCGFINGGNIADGANGLLSSIFFAFFLIAYSLDASIFNFSVLISLLVFIIFNVCTGKIFLGDFGAYFLSSLVAFKCLELYSYELISVFFVASVLIYPCFEIIRSLVIRSIRSVSVMMPDNNHLHNYLNEYLLNFGLSKHIANSLTGLIIASSSALIPVALYFSGISVKSHIWIILFLIQSLLLSLIYIYFEKKFSRYKK